MDEERCLQYLKANPYVLEALVTGPFVSRETFQKWAKKRDQKIRVESRGPPSGNWIVNLYFMC